MDPSQRRAAEASTGLFLMGLGLVVMLLNVIADGSDLSVSILGLGVCVVGGCFYRSR
jgi:hypothetical protein